MIKQGSKVKAHYTGKLTNNEVFDTSLVDGRDPLEFTIGEGLLIPGFENGILGLNTGDKKTVEVLPVDAYGEYKNELLATIPKTNAPQGVEIGQTLQANMDGKIMQFMVRQVNEENIVVDGNHPLAGKNIQYEIKLNKIIESNEEKVRALTLDDFKNILKSFRLFQRHFTLM